jgi:predicted nucleic acid-binding protein
VEYLVLDTDAASHLQRGSLPAPLHEHLRGTIVCVTFITVGEFFKGAFKRQWGERRVQQLEAWLRNVVVLPYASGISRAWGRVCAECEAKGQPIPPNDAWIAACCLSHDLALMTLNRRHFERVEGLRLVPHAPVTGK